MLEYYTNKLHITGVQNTPQKEISIPWGKSSYIEFQPIVCSDTLDIRFYECLFRSTSVDKFCVNNISDVVKEAEKLRVCYQIDLFVLKNALRELVKYPHLKLTVNVSKTSLVNKIWIDQVKKLFSSLTNIEQRLMIEVTETSRLSQLDETLRSLQMLKDYGCLIALDDFGTGFTSVEELKLLPIDIVKIDKSYIEDIIRVKTRCNSWHFIHEIINYCQNSGKKVVLEGIEKESFINKVAELKTDYMQGYAFGRPSLWHKYNNKNSQYLH